MEKLFTTLLLWSLISPLYASNEIGFVEKYAIAEDRAAALADLIPGTEEFFFYHCLHAQHSENKADFNRYFIEWRTFNKGHINNAMQEMLNRQALMAYPNEPKASLEHLQRRLNLSFGHQPEIGQPKHHGPTRLNPKEIAADAFLKRFTAGTVNLNHFEKSGQELLLDHPKFTPELRRALLEQLSNPAFPRLAEMIIADLKYKDSRGFGSLNIHRQLTSKQLAELAEQLPKLKTEDSYLNEVIRRLLPGEHISLQHDDEALEAYLHSVWAVLKPLGSAHNTRKANTLYQMLRMQQKRGHYDQTLFITYLQLPRPAPYMHADYLKAPAQRAFHCNLKKDYSSIGPLPPIGSDQALIRDFLLTLLADQKDSSLFAPYIRDTYLRSIFAESKITHGIGDAETWAALISPSEFEALKNRVDIDFAPTNPTHFKAADPVRLKVYLKNTASIQINIFEINTFNYYKDTGEPLNLAVNLDGLVASMSRGMKLNGAAPEIRRPHDIDFPEMNKHGAYIVELIGNGKSSRALIVKGQLHSIQYTSAAGHVFRVFDEDGEQLRDATLWMAKRAYPANNQGEIIIPYSTRRGNEHVIIRHDSMSTLTRFQHEEETYHFSLKAHIDREALIKHHQADLLIRPQFSLNGRPAPVDLLENVQLTITSTSHRGITAQKTIPDFALYNDRESQASITVPPDTASINVGISAKVQNISKGTKENLHDTETFTFNQIDATKRTRQVLLTRDGDNFLVEIRGKNGEPYVGRRIQVDFKHRLFKGEHGVSMQTDERGQVFLGPLPDIEHLRIHSSQPVLEIPLPGSRAIIPSTIHASAQEAIHLPMPVKQSGLTFFRVDHGAFHEDLSDLATHKDGALHLPGLPSGKYELRIPQWRRNVSIVVSPGKLVGDVLVEAHRILDTSVTAPPYIAKVESTKDELKIRLAQTNLLTRVHVFAHRYAPEFDALSGLSAYPDRYNPSMFARPKSSSFYFSGRKLGDEYRYILERQRRPKFPGNMLERPGLLLNPWALQDTATETEVLAPMANVDSMADLMESLDGLNALMGSGQRKTKNPTSNLDFLKQPGVVLYNLIPDKDGFVTIDRSALKGKPWVQIIATDAAHTVVHEMGFPAEKTPLQENRLVTGFDPEKRFTRQQVISVLQQGDKLTIKDASNAKMRQYDSLASAFRLLENLSRNATLREFKFITEWPALDNEKQRTLYAKFACHELSFFLYHRDRPFFDQVILPYLANKKDKTFMDHWLLNQELASYVTTWKFNRLNIVERILLAQRIKNTGTARQIRDLSELIANQPEKEQYIFLNGVRTQGLDKQDRFAGFAMKERRLAESKSELVSLELPSDKFAMADRDDDGLSDIPAAPARALSAAFEDRATTLSRAKGATVRKPMSRRAEAIAEKSLGTAGRYIQPRFEGREKTRSLFRKLDQTKEWAENNYYKLPIKHQGSSLIGANLFWQDLRRTPTSQWPVSFQPICQDF